MPGAAMTVIRRGQDLVVRLAPSGTELDFFQVADSAWAFARDEQERYRLARAWRQDHQLPERVFYRVPVERKPAAADFRSLVLVNLLAKHIRQTQAAGHAQYAVTEMLPDTSQLWLTDRHGRRYSSELRIIAYDNTAGDHPPPDRKQP